MQFDKYQQAFIDGVLNTKDNLLANALAGSGKSTTVEGAVTQLEGKTSVLVLAFNKIIADGMQQRFDRAGVLRCSAKTFNSLGHGACMRNLPGVKLERFKTGGIMRELGIKFKERLDQQTVERLVGLAKSAPFKCGHVAWDHLIEHMGFAIGDPDTERAIINAADACFTHSRDLALKKGIIDFNDQLWLPIDQRWVFNRVPYVFVDESQDLSAIQIEMLTKVTGDRLFCVGDPRQAIYGFRGADSSAIESLQKRFSLVNYPLNVCYRCDDAIIEHVKRLVPHIECRPGAGKGSVTSLDEWEVTDFTPADAVLCRNNGPLFALAAHLIDARMPFQIKGDGMGELISNYIGRVLLTHNMPKGNIPLSRFMPAAREWFKAEEARYEKAGMFGMCDTLSDYAYIFEVLANVDGVSDLDGLLAIVEKILLGKEGVTLSSVHRAKGLEWPRVFILEPHLMPSTRAKEQWQKQQELNLMYVAETRAMHDLCYLPLEVLR